jgi:hypothetical protein
MRQQALKDEDNASMTHVSAFRVVSNLFRSLNREM